MIKKKENGGTINRIWTIYTIDKDTKSIQCLEHMEMRLVLCISNWAGVALR